MARRGGGFGLSPEEEAARRAAIARDISTSFFGRRAGSAIGNFAEGGLGGIGTLVVGLQFALTKLSSTLDDLSKAIDKGFGKEAKPQELTTSPQQLAAAIKSAPTTGPFGSTTVLGNVAAELGTITSGPGGMFQAAAALFGRQPKSGAKQYIDSLSMADLLSVIPQLDGDLRNYAEKRLEALTGHTVQETRNAQAFAQSSYGQQIANVTYNVNAPVGDRNSIGLAIKAASDARARNNGQYVSPFVRRG